MDNSNSADNESQENVADEEDLQPCVKEFIPGYQTLEAYSKALVDNVLQATKSANSLPLEGDDFDYYSSFPGFKTFCSKMSSRINKIFGKAMRHYQLPCYWPPVDSSGGAEDVDERFEVLLEANDILLERVGTLLDEAVEGKGERALATPVVQQGVAEVASWNKKQKDRETMSTYHFIHTKNIGRPQLKFKDHIDNSSTPFIPHIRSKPHALHPLPEIFQRLQAPVSLNAVIANAKEWSQIDTRLIHPYQYELDHFEPCELQLQLSEPKLATGLESTPFMYIETFDDLLTLQQALMDSTEFAVDLEAHSYRSYQGFVCLMQVSTRSCDYIVDTLKLREHMHILLDPFTNPQIVKVMHGADWDVPWLQRDFGIYVVNLFDTGQASRVLELPKFSLAYLLQYCCNVLADKQYQLADWRIRPLPEEMMKYAREDTHYLLYIYDRMRNELVRRSNKNLNLLRSVLERSRDICLKLYTKPQFTEDGYLNLYHKHKKEFSPQQLLCLKLLYGWRDQVARDQDESTNYVLPNHMLFQIAEFLPREPQGVHACCNPIPTIVRQELNEIFRLVQQAREQQFKPPSSTIQPKSSVSVVGNTEDSATPIADVMKEPGVSLCSTVFADVSKSGPPVPTKEPSLSALGMEVPPVVRTKELTEKYNKIVAGFPKLLNQFMEAKVMTPAEVILHLARRNTSSIFGIASPVTSTTPVAVSPLGTPVCNKSLMLDDVRGDDVRGADVRGDDAASSLDVRDEKVEGDEGVDDEEDVDGETQEDESSCQPPELKKFKKPLSVREIIGVGHKLKRSVRTDDSPCKHDPVKKQKPMPKQSLDTFDYGKVQFSDFVGGWKEPASSDVFDPSKQWQAHRKNSGPRSRVNMKSGERSHTYGGQSNQSWKRQSWPKGGH